jgi:mutator protein MutT
MYDITTQNNYIYRFPPPGFNPKFQAAACFIKAEDSFLFLLRSAHKSEGLKWGIPGGKMDPGELPENAVVREIYEETQLKLTKENLHFLDKVYIRYPEMDFTYYMYEYCLASVPKYLQLNDEHIDYRWIKLEEALQLPLMRGESECIEISYPGIQRSYLSKPKLPVY